MFYQTTITWKGDEVDVDIDYSPGIYRPANTSGPPDNWHPDESEPPEIGSVKVSDTGEEILDELSDGEIERLLTLLCDVQMDSDGPDYERDDDYNDDDWQAGQDAWEASQGI